jgi:hypothetical protein
MGSIVDDPLDFYTTRIPRKQQKNTILEELIEDAKVKKSDFLLYFKKKYSLSILKFHFRIGSPRSNTLRCKSKRSTVARSSLKSTRTRTNARREKQTTRKNRLFVFLLAISCFVSNKLLTKKLVLIIFKRKNKPKTLKLKNEYNKIILLYANFE